MTKREVSETFAVAGYVVDENGRIDGILLGGVEDGALRYAGAVDRGLGASPDDYHLARSAGRAGRA